MNGNHSSSHVATSPETTDLDSEDVVIEEVKRAVRSIEFGSVLIKIHQGEVVGIETSTKVRLNGGRP